jgi:diguanylate cyclase (GGDEF)-like protein
MRALQGLALSIGSPLGWLLLQWLDGADPFLQLVWHPGVYVYMLLGTAIAFGVFGWYVGRQEETYRETSLHDALTGLYNPRYFWRRLGDEHAFAARHRRPLALLIGDIDFFKRVNDTHGHAAGDQVLGGVADALMGARRRGDTVARVGGEEFAVILPETEIGEALRVAERLRAAVGKLRFELDHRAKGAPLRVTMSFGAAVVAGESRMSGADLYQWADTAMYRAKQEGRDRVAAAEPSPMTAVAAATPAPRAA